MSLTAAASGFVVFLLSVQVIQAQNGWGVTYTSTQICALKGSTVEISCTYTYPSRINGRDTTVQESFWFTQMNGDVPVDLRTDSEYAGRLQYSCSNNICTLRITDLRESDSAEYKFMFITNQPGGRFTGSPGVTLSVTDPDLRVQVIRSTVYRIYTEAELLCHSSCRLPYHPSYVWYKNGQKIQTETSSSYLGHFYSKDSYSCAVKGLEGFPSPSVCVRYQYCNRVTYTDRSICAFKGSSVDISCTYNSFYTIRSKFWFRPERSLQWQNPSQPEDLSEDSQYADRVQVLETERGRSTLRITDLRESDSAEYHFKFKTGKFEWRSSLPGTTLTVTDLDLQVQVIRSTVYQNYTEAELLCHSSCRLPDRSSYIWFKNGQKMERVETSSYKDQFYPGDIISCAVKGHEDFRSPSVCVAYHDADQTAWVFHRSVLGHPPGQLLQQSVCKTKEFLHNLSGTISRKLICMLVVLIGVSISLQFVVVTNLSGKCSQSMVSGTLERCSLHG
ncbi:uncharacterized protein LOC119898104 [Micropterus salmoides]|uniref:uncharacterized protein LOC119898104 n=1 Tax=Micropterus salmoides TaxID=27706 RepID=UPI0018EB6E37|nr:uncharacterized protein LOC119898104 [Micropterus salmoides]